MEGASIDVEDATLAFNATAPDQANRAQAAALARSHKCDLCLRAFERADHLNRHLRSHENARRHKCTLCPKRFNRADLLHRHLASHERGSDSNPGSRHARGERVATACLWCVASKTKCQTQRPCARCRRKNLLCESTANREHGGERPPSPPQPTNPEPFTESMRRSEPSTNLSSQDLRVSQGATEIRRNPSHRPTVHFDDAVFEAPLVNDFAPEANDPIAGSAISPYTGNVLAPATVATELQAPPLQAVVAVDDHFQDTSDLLGAVHFSQEMNFAAQDLDFDVWGFSLDDVEMVYGASGQSHTGDDNRHPTTNSSPQTPQSISRRHAAFERSPWLWVPTHSDQTLNDQSHLDLDEGSISPLLNQSSRGIGLDDFTSLCVDSKSRDRMLSLLFSLRRNGLQNPTFPSSAFLTSIIHAYFIQESISVDQLIHAPSFSAANSLTQLLFAIISAGSSFISIPAVWKMGMVLQEIVRLTVSEFWEQDNSHTGNIQALQAFVIGLDVGLWSGFKRNMEIAESVGQPVIMILRRRGAFAYSTKSPVIIPDLCTTASICETQWRKWVEQESFKRLVLHLFIHDVHGSVGFSKPPLISFTELKLGLPASRDLWRAKSSSTWRRLALERKVGNVKLPSFLEALHNMDVLEQNAHLVDVELTVLAILHGYWGQIWRLLESKKFYPKSSASHWLSILTEHDELYRSILNFSASLPQSCRTSPQIGLISEFFMMIMHVTPEDLQHFAGKNGEAEANKAFSDFQSWTRSSDSRKAIWHAGQVFKAAQRFSSARLRGFYCISVYYATLALWIYGLVTSSNDSIDTDRRSNLTNATPPATRASKSHLEIALNEPETLQSRLFRSNGEGIPGILAGEQGQLVEFIPLVASDKILHLAQSIFRNNFPVNNEPLPPLLENLGRLLKDLGSENAFRASRAPSEDL